MRSTQAAGYCLNGSLSAEPVIVGIPAKLDTDPGGNPNGIPG